MNSEEQTTSIVEAWLKGTSDTPYGTEMGVGRVKSRARRTRQRGRWWPLPSFTRSTSPAPSIPSTQFQSTPIPATNGHTPTVTGRTQSMFSPAKAITAAALVFAIGGVMLIAQPFDQQGGGVPGAATEEAREAPTEFSGRLAHGLPIEEPLDETVDGVIVGQSVVFGPLALTMSDPRLDGEATITTESRVFGGEDGVTVFNKAFRIENDAGAWQEVPGFVMEPSPGWTSTFIGEGDYAGLFAIADVLHDSNGWDLHGYIIDGDVPPDLAPTSME
jgi:hypothetical protein